MVLREGLLWHDGKPVTAEDCVASIRRWGAKDAMGQKLMSFVKDMSAETTGPFTTVHRLMQPTVVISSRRSAAPTAVQRAARSESW